MICFFNDFIWWYLCTCLINKLGLTSDINCGVFFIVNNLLQLVFFAIDMQVPGILVHRNLTSHAMNCCFVRNTGLWTC